MTLRWMALWLRVATVVLAVMFTILAVHWFREGQADKAWIDVGGAIACCLLNWFIWRVEKAP